MCTLRQDGYLVVVEYAKIPILATVDHCIALVIRSNYLVLHPPHPKWDLVEPGVEYGPIVKQIVCGIGLRDLLPRVHPLKENIVPWIAPVPLEVPLTFDFHAIVSELILSRLTLLIAIGMLHPISVKNVPFAGVHELGSVPVFDPLDVILTARTRSPV